MKWRDAVQELVFALSIEDEGGVYNALEKLEMLQDEPLDLDEQRFFDRLNLIIEQEIA